MIRLGSSPKPTDIEMILFYFLSSLNLSPILLTEKVTNPVQRLVYAWVRSDEIAASTCMHESLW